MVSEKRSGRSCDLTKLDIHMVSLLRIEVNAVGDSDEHVAVGDAVVLGHAIR